MTRERAQQIVDACAAHTWYDMGIREELPPSLQEYSLRELLDANEMMSGPVGKSQNPDGSTNTSLHCADRMVAALYVLYHYPADKPGDAESIVHNGRAGVFVARATED
jgi:hypothetical protein